MLPIKSVSFEALIAKRQAIIEKADQMMQLKNQGDFLKTEAVKATT